MSDLNAEITTQSMDLLKLAKVATKKSIREMVQDAIDEWLRRHGMTPDKLPKFDMSSDPRAKPKRG